MKHPHLVTHLLAGAMLVGAMAAQPAFAWEKGKILIWVNNDKGWKGLQKVGDEFTKKTGIKVKVETPYNPTEAYAAAMAWKARTDAVAAGMNKSTARRGEVAVL